ncbi:hypothetical protein [Zobellia uliginosa]|nr:hypothetical protein [Zobellia uliginosa]MBU2948847.1 hypothetical protein [Zobellia uliginosa]
MKNLIHTISDQLARVGRVRSVQEFSSDITMPENFIMGMTNSDHQNIKG